MTKLSKIPSGLLVSVKNIGPVADFDLSLETGINVIEGKNGAGKSTICAAVIQALTEESKDKPEFDLTARLGSERGVLSINGVPLLSIGQKVRKIGKEFELRLAALWPIGDLIEPGLKKEAADKARIKAFLQLVNAEVTEEVVSILVDKDEDALAYIEQTESIKSLSRTDIIDATERIRKGLHNRKGFYATEATRVDGELKASAPKSIPVILSKIEPAQAEKEYEEAIRFSERVTGESSQRKQREQEREKIAESLGKRPDIETHRIAVESAHSEVKAARQTVRDLEEWLVAAKSIRDNTEQKADTANERFAAIEEETKIWDTNQAILAEALTGPEEADIQEAERLASNAKAALEASKETAAYNSALARCQRLGEVLVTLQEDASRYKNLAETVTSRLGTVLSKSGIPNATVDDQNRLCVIHPDNRIEPLSSLSYGQRVRFVIPLLSNGIKVDGKQLVVLDWKFWNALTKDKQQETGRIFSEAGLIGLSEAPEECELRLIHVA